MAQTKDERLTEFLNEMEKFFVETMGMDDEEENDGLYWSMAEPEVADALDDLRWKFNNFCMSWRTT